MVSDSPSMNMDQTWDEKLHHFKQLMQRERFIAQEERMQEDEDFIVNEDEEEELEHERQQQVKAQVFDSYALSMVEEHVGHMVDLSKCEDLPTLFAEAKALVRQLLKCGSVAIFLPDSGAMLESRAGAGNPGPSGHSFSRAQSLLDAGNAQRYGFLSDFLNKEPLDDLPPGAERFSESSPSASPPYMRCRVHAPDGIAVAVVRVGRKLVGSGAGVEGAYSDGSFADTERQALQVVCTQLGVHLYYQSKLYRLQQERRQQMVLKDTVTQLFTDPDPDSVVARASLLIAKVTDAATARVVLVNEKEDTTTTYRRGPDRKVIREDKPIEGVVKMILALCSSGGAQDAVINVADTRNDIRLSSLKRIEKKKAGAKGGKKSNRGGTHREDDLPPSLMALPIRDPRSGNAVGAVICRDKSTGGFSQADVELVKEIAVLFHKAYEHVTRVAARSVSSNSDHKLTTSLDVAEIQEVAARRACLELKCTAATVFLFDEHMDQFMYTFGKKPCVLPLDCYPVGECFVMRRAVFLPNISQSLRMCAELQRPQMEEARATVYKYATCLLCLPIISPETSRILGVMQVISSSPSGLKASDDTLLLPLCERSGLALANAMRLQVTLRSEASLARLAAVSGSVVVAANEEEMVESVASGGTAIFGVQHCLLFLPASTKQEVWTVVPATAPGHLPATSEDPHSPIGSARSRKPNYRFTTTPRLSARDGGTQLLTIPLAGLMKEAFRTKQQFVFKSPVSPALQQEFQSILVVDKAITSAMLSPILRGDEASGEVIGLFLLVNSSAGVFSTEDRAALSRLSSLVGGCLAKFHQVTHAAKSLKQATTVVTSTRRVLDELFPMIISQKHDAVLLQTVERLAAEAVSARRCDVLSVDWNRSQLTWHDADRPDVFMKFWRIVGITGAVATAGVPEIVPDVRADKRFDPIVDDWHEGFATRSLLLAPVLDIRGQVTCILQIHNKADGEAFTQDDVDVASRVAALYAMAVGRKSLLQRHRALGPTMCEVHHHLERPEMLKRVVAVAATACEAREVKLYLVVPNHAVIAAGGDADSVTLQLATMVVTPDDGDPVMTVADKSTRVPLLKNKPELQGDEVAQECASTQRLVNTMRRDTANQAGGARGQSSGSVAVPVFGSSGQLRAVLQASDTVSGGFGEADEDVLGIIATQCGAGMANCDRYSKQTNARQKLVGLLGGMSTLYECRSSESVLITVTRIVKQLLACEVVSAFTLDSTNSTRFKIQYDPDGPVVAGSQSHSHFYSVKSKVALEVVRTMAPTGNVKVDVTPSEAQLTSSAADRLKLRQMSSFSGDIGSPKDTGPKQVRQCYGVPLRNSVRGEEADLAGVLVLVREPVAGPLSEEDENLLHSLCDITQQLLIKTQRHAEDMARRMFGKVRPSTGSKSPGKPSSTTPAPHTAGAVGRHL